jgi:class 3 adenylate cyclase
VNGIIDGGFTHEIVRTKLVPSIYDGQITFLNLSTKTQKSKLLTSAVLFVDMRGSTKMSMDHTQEELAPVYSSFVRAMSKCAHYFHGHVRNIIDDRVMVVFDRVDCYKNAVDTAMLMNSVVKYVLNKKISEVTVRAGIGIDFGPMLVTKTGVIKQGDENDPNKALVWLGKPANVASKLTDMANKLREEPKVMVREGHQFVKNGDWHWYEYSVEYFLDKLVNKYPSLRHQDESFQAFITTKSSPPTNPPILFTKYFYDQYKKEHPDQSDIDKGWWNEVDITVPGYPNRIMGGDVIFTVFQN